MGLSANSATEISDLGIFGDFWGDGADSAKKVDTSLADECLPHRERGSFRLGEPHTWRVSARS